jgi:hypothetical protein
MPEPIRKSIFRRQDAGRPCTTSYSTAGIYSSQLVAMMLDRLVGYECIKAYSEHLGRRLATPGAGICKNDTAWINVTTIRYEGDNHDAGNDPQEGSLVFPGICGRAILLIGELWNSRELGNCSCDVLTRRRKERVEVRRHPATVGAHLRAGSSARMSGWSGSPTATVARARRNFLPPRLFI